MEVSPSSHSEPVYAAVRKSPKAERAKFASDAFRQLMGRTANASGQLIAWRSPQ
jgi:hypothetical protein